MDKSAVTTLVLLMCLPVLKGCVFPKECVQGYDGRVRRCCPNYKNSPCGSDLGRGYCGAVGTIRAVYPPDINEDERKDFPRFFFNETCHCYDKYMGPNCGECNFGYRGPTCKEQYNVTRRDFRELSLAEMTAYNAALHYCKSKIDPEFVIMRTSDRFRKRSFEFLEASYYDVLCFTHYYATKDLISNSKETAFSINFAHGSTGFLSWHRYYLLLTERQIQKCLKNDSWALAYYQWQYDSECFVCDNDYFGKSNINGKIESQSVYSTWRLVCGVVDYPATVCMMEDCECERERIVRKVGFSDVIKSTREHVDACLNISVIDAYPFDWNTNTSRNCIEGNFMGNKTGTYMHNAFHVYIGGTMTLVSTSCNDPLFLAHHCNVDKIFEDYIKKYNITPKSYPNNEKYPFHKGSSCMAPFYNCKRHSDMFIKSSTFGVIYKDYVSP